MTVKDRTQEFFAAVDSLQQRHTGAMHASQLMNRLEQQRNTTSAAGFAVAAMQKEKKTEFARMAAHIGREINATAMAKKKSLFDDRPVEIQELTHVIKQDISKLNGQIKGLERYLTEQRSTTNRQTQEYSTSVVVSLQSQLATASSSFKDILEIRSETMRQQKERRDQFGFSGTNASGSSFPSTDSPLYALDRRDPSTSQSQGFISIDMPLQQQQLQMVDQSNAYMESRTEAIEGIEKTISELAGIFQQLTTMISAHDDLVRRIDHNVEAVETNVALGQQQLLKYMNSISSNRWLLIKIFLILIAFFLVFVLFFA